MLVLAQVSGTRDLFRPYSLAFAYFGRSVDPIKTKGADYGNHKYYLAHKRHKNPKTSHVPNFTCAGYQKTEKLCIELKSIYILIHGDLY